MIETVFKAQPGGTVLFLGRVTHFSSAELQHFLEAQGMIYADNYTEQEVVLLILSSRMTPAEEQHSYLLYDAGVPDTTLEQFEQYMSTHIQPKMLLMSLKLSGDQERLRRLLGNEAFPDTLYLKLLEMYDWGSDGIHENDANRDVTISFVKRFYHPDGFRDPAMIYAPSTMMIIGRESDNPAVLEAILSMPNHEIKVSRYEQKRPKNLREMVAFNPHISAKILKRLLAYAILDIDYFLASNAAVGAEALERLYARSNSQIKRMMAQHPSLPDTLFMRLLEETDEETVQGLLVFQSFDEKRLNAVWGHQYIAYLGANRQIGAYIQRLLDCQDDILDTALASNPSVASSCLEKLWERHSDTIAAPLAANPNITSEMAQRLYVLGEKKVLEALAANASTPVAILDAMCELENRELNRFLASNPSVKITWLRRFQLDTSLLRILAGNKTYGEEILRGLGI